MTPRRTALLDAPPGGGGAGAFRIPGPEGLDPGFAPRQGPGALGTQVAPVRRERKLSLKGLQLIEHHEGFRSEIYADPAGYRTIGYGHRLLPGENFSRGITRAQAAALLGKDVRSAESKVNRALKVPLSQNQYDALVDFAFNCGPRSVSGPLDMMNAVNNGRVGARNFTAYRYITVEGKQVVDEVLLARRQAEWLLYSQGVYAT